MVEQQEEVKENNGEPWDADKPAPAGVLSDPALSRTLHEDPLFKFISTNYKQVLFVLVAVVLGAYGYQTFSNARREAQSSVSDQMNKVREQYTSWLETQYELKKLSGKNYGEKEQEQKVNDQKRITEINESIKKSTDVLQGAVRALGDNGAPYDKIAAIYEGMIARVNDNFSAAQVSLGADWAQIPALTPERLLAEISTLALARARLDQPNEVNAGKATLKQLARSGNYVYVSAALSISQLASTEEEVKEATEILEGIKAKAPKQAELIDPELDALKNR